MRERGSEIRGVVDRRRDRVPVVLQEAEDVEGRRHDPFLSTVLDDLALVRLRNRPPPRLLERLRIQRLDAEAHGAEPRIVQLGEQLDIEPIEPRLRLERQREATCLDLVAQLDTSVTLLAEQRIAKDDV